MIAPEHKVRLRLLGFDAETIAYLEAKFFRWTQWEATISIWESDDKESALAARHFNECAQAERSKQ